MGQIITGKGLNDLIDLKKKGITLPQGWKKDIEAYIFIKERIKASWFAEYLEAVEDLKDALSKARFLHGK